MEVQQELRELKSIVSRNAETCEQIVWLIKGNKELEIPGMQPTINNLKRELDDVRVTLEDLRDWREVMTNAEAMRKVRRDKAGKAIAWTIGVIGGLIGIITAVMQMLE